MTWRMWSRPMRGGMKSSTRSENMINPTLSLLLIAENASVALNSVTNSRFVCQ